MTSSSSSNPALILNSQCVQSSFGGRRRMSKLPMITAFFWIMKILATTLGETGGDLVAQTLNVG